MTWKTFFEGKKVTQLGLGLLGRGVRDAEFLASCGAELIVTDKKSALDLATSVSALSAYPDITFVLGEHRFEDFENRDFILKGAGVPLDSEYIAHARKQGIPVYMDEALFTQLAPDVVHLGVTGTRGKTTTTMLIHHIAYRAFAASEHSVFLGGNIKEVATLPFLNDVQAGDIMIAELSSWQLQGFGELQMSPHIAVFTNLLPDHLNYYNNSMEAYFADKANIYRFQHDDDVLICTPNVAELFEKYNVPAPARCTVVDAANYQVFIQASPLVGEHNALNIACAVEACRELGIDDADILEAITSFTGAPGRLEKIREGALTIYNDTTSTTPDALIAAVRAVGSTTPAHSTVLICGGADKFLDFAAAYEPIAQVAKAVFLTPGSGSVRIFPELEAACNAAGIPIVQAASTADAVLLAKEYLTEGTTLLFSPGFASFAEFKNEYDRGEKFEEFVAQIV